MKFKDIEFGKADAFEESVDFPNLLINGYLDPQQLVESSLKTSTFLFLGNKGSGKSALSHHLNLTKSNYNLFVSSVLLEDFSYKSFAKILSGDSDTEVKYPIAWDWILLIYAINSLSKDEGAKTILKSELESVLTALRELKILPLKHVSDIVSKSSKVSFKANLYSVFEFAFESGSNKDPNDIIFSHLVGYLKDLALSFYTPSSHIVVIDGLDEVLSTRDVQYQSLAALISSVRKINIIFRQNNVNFKFILLCRTDLFERLPHPNKNKVRQDSSVVLSWFDESSEISEMNLIKLANLRAKLVFPNLNDLFSEFFPNMLEGKDIRKFLLDFTRHTPRDFLQLLKFVQKSPQLTNEKINITNIYNSVNDYSINYFLPEIKDELVGYFSAKEIETMFQIISSNGKREFYLKDIQAFVDEKEIDLQLDDFFRTLFECSAIGNIMQNRERQTIFTFKYRNHNVSFNPKERVILHKGIWKSLNLFK